MEISLRWILVINFILSAVIVITCIFGTYEAHIIYYEIHIHKCANHSENTENLFCYESSLVTEIMNVINSGGDIPTLTANMFSQ